MTAEIKVEQNSALRPLRNNPYLDDEQGRTAMLNLNIGWLREIRNKAPLDETGPNIIVDDPIDLLSWKINRHLP
ncbi:MAG TPA: hypothetical protein ENF85_01870 [Candidatus Bathyarchaeota archaeon]|nr:hypothetical protein [Candidatus Bathyarchaeota archaeon]